MGHHPITTARHAQQWLQAYGYDTVEQMQEFYGLAVDGVIGPQTIGAMNIPRCGVPDFRLLGDCRWKNKRQFRYWLGPGFNLFRKAGKPGKKLARDMIVAGFEAWTEVTGFTFVPAAKPTDTDFWIGGGRGREFDFDGPGNTLAWAYMPCGAFDALEMRFDIDERWSPQPVAVGDSIYAMSVWLHELGHLLGLDHSRNPNDIMAAYYNPAVHRLQAGDVTRIRRLYDLPGAAAAVPSEGVPQESPLQEEPSAS
jgi:hypothetical protein